MAAASASAAGAVVGLGVGCALVALFLRDQRLPVGDRDLIVVGMDFGKSQKAMAVATVIDEGRLQRGLNARDFGKVDVTAQLFTVGALEVEFFDAIST
jgi:hypothetical protein